MSFIPKEGRAHDLKSLRPLSVTALWWRIMAKHLYRSMAMHIDRHLSDAQWGGRHSRSCVAPALSVKHFFDRANAKEHPAYAVQLDLTKCFNGINIFDSIRITLGVLPRYAVYCIIIMGAHGLDASSRVVLGMAFGSHVEELPKETHLVH